MQHVSFTLRSCFLIVCLLVFLQLLLFCSNFFNLEQRTWSTNDKKTKKQTKFMITLHIFVNTKYYISQYFKCAQLNQRGKPALGETQRVHFRKNAWHYSASRGQQFQKWNMTVIQGLVLLLPPKCICLYTLLQPLEQPTTILQNFPTVPILLPCLLKATYIYVLIQARQSY